MGDYIPLESPINQDEFCTYTQGDIAYAFEAFDQSLAEDAARARTAREEDRSACRAAAARAGLSQSHISLDEETVTFFVEGGLIDHDRGRKFGPASGRGDRGIITGFSKTSRLRLLYTIARITRSIVPIFLTLTYPDHFSTDPGQWSRDMDTFAQRLARKGWAAVWRKEFKCRKSGDSEGSWAPHFHLLVWGCTFEELFLFAHQAWYDVVNSGDVRHLRAGVRVEVLRDVRGTRGYVSKYAAKLDEYEDLFPDGCGRLWGVVNRAAIPWSDAVVVKLNHAEANKLLRLMRRYMQSKRTGLPRVRMLCNAPEFWFDRIDELVT